ncbi:MAG: hypothetical protein C4529_13005 [Deltaproteobacteria bacterium]|nr:MAG: hypothetical protein C4529_13005 [Deltaproteobacteria bacterium]
MTDAELCRRVQLMLGKPHAEIPCWKIVDALYGVPLIGAREVDPKYMQAGDVVVFGEREQAPDYGIGVYLGNGKVVTSFKETGVVMIPWRFVKASFVGGLRVG